MTDASLRYKRFETRSPSSQTALDIFSGRWTSDCSHIAPGTISGETPHFRDDRRCGEAAELFDGLDGKRILELGPMEGAHTWKMEQLGADEIIAVEANTEAYLKCLVVKEISGMKRAHFLLGDFSEYLAGDHPRFDLIFCSGVLYHMRDPARLISLMAAATDRVFVWTHYFRPELKHSLALQKQKVIYDGMHLDYYVGKYPNPQHERFLGGNQDEFAWLEQGQLFDLFRHFGLVNIRVLGDELDHPNGACITFGAWR
jgi:hypothetical protein